MRQNSSEFVKVITHNSYLVIILNELCGKTKYQKNTKE